MNNVSGCRADCADAFDVSAQQLLQSVSNLSGSKVTVALSGGADSVALCHFMHTVAEKYGFTLQAAHLNHGLRGPESDADEQFVRSFCKKLDIPLISETLTWQAVAHPGENRLRSLRYQFLWKAAGDGFLATAHTCTDSCETLLLHLARGSRLGGMRGIPARSGRLLRPLVGLTRLQIEDYCSRNDLSFVTDSTNLSDQYARNRIRHTVLPTLESVNPAAQTALLGWMQEADELYRYLDGQVTELLQSAAVEGHTDSSDVALQPVSRKINTDASVDPDLQGQTHTGPFDAAILQKAPELVLRYALNRLLSAYGDSSAARIAAAVKVVREQGALDWCDGVRLICKDGTVSVVSFCAQREKVTARDDLPIRIPAAEGEWQLSTEVKVTIRRLERLQRTPDGQDGENLLFREQNSDKILKFNKKDLYNCLDYAKIIKHSCCERQCDGDNMPMLRFRQQGDRFCLNDKKGTKTLKKWFNEIAVPVDQRDQLPLLAFDSTVIWLAGSGAARAFAASEKTDILWQICLPKKDCDEDLI